MSRLSPSPTGLKLVPAMAELERHQTDEDFVKKSLANHVKLLVKLIGSEKAKAHILNLKFE